MDRDVLLSMRPLKRAATWITAGLAALLAAGCGSGAADAGFGTGGGAADTTSSSSGTGGGAPSPPLHATSIAVGRAHSCAVLDDGTVACWGAGDRGQLGDRGSGADHGSAVPKRVPDLGGARAVRAALDTTCALLDGGTVRCWGEGGFGQLGDGEAFDGHFEKSPVEVVGLGGVADLSMSGTNACAVLDDGTVRCWGLNSADEWLGFASAECGPYMVKVGDADPMPASFPCESAPHEVPGVAGVIAIATGGPHTCARLAGGSVSCWGADAFGQLGDGNFGASAHSPTPLAIAGLTGADRVGAGSSHTCATLEGGKITCWGDNSSGQLGIGTGELNSYKTTPAAVPALTGVVDVAIAGATTCAIDAAGAAWCWGDVGSLLPPMLEADEAIALAPVRIEGLAGVAELRTGGLHACARLTDGSVVCFGLNEHGQLGSGVTGLEDFDKAPVAAPRVPPK